VGRSGPECGQSRGLKPGDRRLNSLRLQQMTVLMPSENLEPGADRKTNHRNERIPEPDPIHIKRRGPAHQLTRGFVATQELIENGDVNLLVRCDFFRGSGPAFGGG